MFNPLERAKKALIAEWKGSWKLWSVQANAVGLALMSFGELMRDSVNMVPPAIAARLPHAEVIGIAFFTLGLVARLLRQVKAPDGADE